jgi:hypothetical protein
VTESGIQILSFAELQQNSGYSSAREKAQDEVIRALNSAQFHRESGVGVQHVKWKRKQPSSLMQIAIIFGFMDT